MAWPFLDGERVEGPVPPSHEHAAELLRQTKRQVSRIIRVDPDVILYLGVATGEHPEGRPMTAWIKHDAGTVRIFSEPGFQALCPAGVFQVAEE